jgi:outer membrane protein assembly factor BamE
MTLISTRRALLALAPLMLLSACAGTGNVSLSKPETLFGLLEPYRIDVVQGNVVTQEVIAQLQPGHRR